MPIYDTLVSKMTTTKQQNINKTTQSIANTKNTSSSL